MGFSVRGAMTGAEGLTALLADVWAVSGDRALLYDGASFVELRLAPGDAARFRRAKDEDRPLIAVGRWTFEATLRGRKRLLAAATAREVALRAPRLARAIASRATTLPDAPFGRDPVAAPAAAAPRVPVVRGEIVPRRFGGDERGIIAILGGAAAIGLTLGIALAAALI